MEQEQDLLPEALYQEWAHHPLTQMLKRACRLRVEEVVDIVIENNKDEAYQTLLRGYARAYKYVAEIDYDAMNGMYQELGEQSE